jgi:hypothetical protein
MEAPTILLKTSIHSFHHILCHSTRNSLICICNCFWDVCFQVIYVERITVVDMSFEMTNREKCGGDRSGDLGGHKPFEVNSCIAWMRYAHRWSKCTVWCALPKHMIFCWDSFRSDRNGLQECVIIQDGVTAVTCSITHRTSLFKLRNNAVNCCFFGTVSFGNASWKDFWHSAYDLLRK